MNIQCVNDLFIKFQIVTRPVDVHLAYYVIHRAELFNSTSKRIGSAVSC
jgi:hypothetical protein